MDYCCVDCFQDKRIKDRIKEEPSSVFDDCCYCGGKGKLVIDPKIISDVFDGIFVNLSQDDNGMSIIVLIDKYLSIFNSTTNKEKLFTSLFQDFDISKNYKFNIPSISLIEQWDLFKEEIKNTKRFFPESGEVITSIVSGESIALILDQLTVTINSEDSFYRARVYDGPLTINDIRMPPSDKVSGGRANPVGIPYLYLASNRQTSIYEVRPQNGETVYCSEFKANKQLRVLDLTKPLEKASALYFGDDDLIFFIQIIELLKHISYELSKPINPNRANIDYIPTQFFTELIKKNDDIDGIKYISSFDEGDNYVFFTQDHFVNNAPRPYAISRNKCEFAKISI